MASPPYGGATSPSSSAPLALHVQRQRPTLALPIGPKSRKLSVHSATSSAHPLRQTSFPPPDSLEAQHALAEDQMLAQYSPSAEGSLDDFSDDHDIQSAISGPVIEDAALGPGRKRKRGDPKPRGRPPRNAPPPPNTEDGRTSQPRRAGTAGATSVVDDAGAGEAEEEDDYEAGDPTIGPGGGRIPLYAGGEMTPAEQEAERKRKFAFYETVSDQHKHRYDVFGRAKLRTADVRKLVNSSLGQSVPQNVVGAVQAFAKMWAGMLIEEARQVQREWEAVEEKRADGEENRAWKRLRMSRKEGKENVANEVERKAEKVEKTDEEMEGVIKNEPSSPDNLDLTNGVDGKRSISDSPSQKLETQSSEPSKNALFPIEPGGAGGLEKDVEECDLGPLLPDHLREALRRYKKRHAGGAVGFTGLSLEGRENTAPRMGGRKLFR